MLKLPGSQIIDALSPNMKSLTILDRNWASHQSFKFFHCAE